MNGGTSINITVPINPTKGTQPGPPNPNFLADVGKTCANLPGEFPPTLLKDIQQLFTVGVPLDNAVGCPPPAQTFPPTSATPVGGTHANAIGYITIGALDVEQSLPFWDAVLGAVGYARGPLDGGWAFYGKDGAPGVGGLCEDSLKQIFGDDLGKGADRQAVPGRQRLVVAGGLGPRRGCAELRQALRSRRLRGAADGGADAAADGPGGGPY